MGSGQAAVGLLLPGNAPAELPVGSDGPHLQPVPAPQQPGGLRVLTWNCFRLNPTRQLDLEILLHKYSPDVAIITEVDRESDEISLMTFPGYNCTAPPASKKKVRVLALTRANIKFKGGPMVADLPVVSLVLPDYKLSIVGVYRQHHGGALGPQVEDLSSIREIVSSLSSSTDICIAGDINLDAGKYGSVPSSSRELYEAWLELTSTNGLDLLPTGPTFKSFGKHQGRHYTSTLDHNKLVNGVKTSPATGETMARTRTQAPRWRKVSMNPTLDRSMSRSLSSLQISPRGMSRKKISRKTWKRLPSWL